MIAQLIFLFITLFSIVFFVKNVRKIKRNIGLGLPLSRSDQPGKRLKVMLKIAFGQTKMMTRPIPALMHFLIYAGFIIINIEVLEIIIDGLMGTHRVFSVLSSSAYRVLISAFEWLAVGVLLACIVFLIRRDVLKLRRFSGTEMTSWPQSDANIILITEILLMSAFLVMNATEYTFIKNHALTDYVAYYKHYPPESLFGSVAPQLSGLFSELSPTTLFYTERFCWWFHIIGIFAFLNYLPYSKHFHIIMAFPNTYYSNLEAKGALNNMPTVTSEVKAILDPSFTPETTAINRFGAKDVTDLTWKNLMDAYTCTECGRCTSVCPANMTGKLLSPRKIMMDTRDRLHEVSKNIDRHGKDYVDNQSLLDDYITREELWACTTCNACTEACPVNIDPLNIILNMRRYITMEESQAPASLNNMFGNMENNGAPWKYSPADRFNWAK